MKKPHPKSKEDQLLEEYICSMLQPRFDESPATSVREPKAVSKPTVAESPDQTETGFKRGEDQNIRQPIDFNDHTSRPSTETLLDTRTPSERFLDRPPELDTRLKQVQNLLARMPAVLTSSPESKPESKAEKQVRPTTQVQTETSKESENKPTVEHHGVNVKVAVKPAEVKVQLPPATAKTRIDNEQVPPGLKPESVDFDVHSRHPAVQELLTEQVAREVVRARDMLGESFQTLIFDVGKLPLAVPLVKLGGIHAYSEEDITPIFGTPDWFKGLIPSEQGNIMLVDTAKYIMPEKYESIKDQLNYKYAILLDDTRWALACTHVREAKTLTLDDIRWAQKGSRKEWFAGMVVQFMCALLEVDSLINGLYRAGKK
jgi:purine-binding chemotaxis protein CheW